MTIARRLASRLLAAAARHASPDARVWADAMRAELESIDGDWAALGWSVGGVCSLLRHFGGRMLLDCLRPAAEPNALPRSSRAAAAELFSGALVAGGIVAAAIVADKIVLRLSWHEFSHLPVGERLLLVAAIEAAFIGSALALPRRRRPLAAGMVLGGMMLFVHVAVHS